MSTTKTKNIWALIGPGFITAALVLGPGSLAVASKIGANFEFKLLWVVPVCILCMSAFTIVATRIGLYLEKSLIQEIKSKYGKPLSLIIGIGLFIVAASFQAGNSIGAAMVFSELFSTSSMPWVFGISVASIGLLFFESFFKILEKIMIALVVFMLFSFLTTLFISQPNWSALVDQFNFTLPVGSELLTVALVASSFSIAGAFYQSYLVQEKGWHKESSKLHERESISGILILGIITATVMLVAATVLFPKGIQVNSATEMGMALEPAFGKYASIVFMLGLFAASFSSLIGNATLGGVLLADALNIGNQLKSQNVRYVIMSVIIVGAAVAIIFGRLPIQLIIMAQGFTIIVVPIIGIILFLMAIDKSKNENMPFGFGLKFVMLIGLIILVLLAMANVYSIFIK